MEESGKENYVRGGEEMEFIEIARTIILNFKKLKEELENAMKRKISLIICKE